MCSTYMYVLLLLVVIGMVYNVPVDHREQKNSLLERIMKELRVKRAQLCPDQTMCRSQWGFCGAGPEYCGKGCTSGPCSNNSDDIINEKTFACAFNTLDNVTRTNRLNALKQSGWKPTNQDEAAVFLSHVFHETDGLKTLREQCAPGCGPNYAGSWCGNIQGKPNKLYFGRGWLQLSWPCNYYAAGQALNVDLLSNPDLVEQNADLAVRTAIWFYKTNKMDIPAQQGDFAATTRIINGQLECNGGSGAVNQAQRVATYKRIRPCFGLGAPVKNPTC